MMQRKKHTPLTSDNTPSNNDDGGSAKHKSTLLFSSLSPLSSTKTISNCCSLYCLPGVPAPLKFILASFIGFAALMVLTAKDHHVHFHYHHEGEDSGVRMHKGMLHGVPGIPEPLHEQLKKNRLGSDGGRDFNNNGRDVNNNERRAYNTATERMMAQPSKFVESEKKLKKQLMKLLQLQNEERKSHRGKTNVNSVLGVKIANRYLGEDMLPYPQNKGDEKQWEAKMEARKEELRKVDEKEWKEMMARYDEVMENYVHEHVGQVGSTDAEVSSALRKQPVDNTNSHEEIDETNSPKGKTWPSPSDKVGSNTTILLKPAFGSHRSSSNAIFVFAEGYELSIYLAFVESLSNSGYTGDVVISISTEEKLKPGVKEYLMSKNTGSELNVVAYEVEWDCFKQSGQKASGSGEGINHCQMNHVFGDSSGKSIPDPREPRPVATARYELYWMWSLQYEKQSWVMLIDARDAWFQLDPFQGLGASKVSDGGELHLFGENADAVRIGTSNYNRNWLITAYGKNAVEPYFEKPVICSGSTVGHQVAIETYLRAMVAEFDSTQCKSKGCDQGFHNYLYYSEQLGDESGEPKAKGISKVIVHEQGTGIINNLAALRDKSLTEWKLYDAEKELVLNWDGSTSAVAHQYDRDQEVNAMVKKKKRQFERHLKNSNGASAQ